MEIHKKLSKGLLAVLLMMGCAHKTEKDIQQKVAEEAHVNTAADFNTESEKAIDDAEGVSDAQKAKLIVLRRDTLAKTEEQDKEEMRLRVVLLKELLKVDENTREINMLKQKIRKVGRKKYSILKDAMKESRAILGKPYVDAKDPFEFEHTIREQDIR